MHGSPLARELAIPRLLVPPTPGILCALGMLVADLRHDLVQTRLAPHADLSRRGGARGVRPDARRGAASARCGPRARRPAADRDAARHALYRPILRIADPALRAASGRTAEDWAALVPAFHAEHARRFGHSDPQAPVEIVSFAVTATGLIDTPELPRPAAGRARAARGSAQAARAGSISRRRLRAAAAGPSAPVWRREALLAGNRDRRAGDRRGNLGDDGALSRRPRPCRSDRQPDRRNRRLKNFRAQP